ncbi:hypothetical protein ACF0H5_001022 [Mactra antiquata]
MLCIDVIKALLVRIVLLIHSLLVVWLATSITKNHLYWLLTVANIALVIETFMTVVRNKAQEWKWFCPCFFFYMCSTIPGIWILELKKMELHQEEINHSDHINHTIQALESVAGVDIHIEMETETLVVIMEQLFLYLMIVSRWVLPRGEITRDELSQLLFVFIGIASDITELFALFEEPKVRENTGLTYAILCVWTVSLMQFTFVLTSTHSPKKPRVALSSHSHDENEADEEETTCLKSFFQTEIWSICVNFLFQDGPFLVVRLYTMITLSLLTYSIIFFTAKNGLLVMLLIYRLCVVFCERKSKIENGEAVSDSASVDEK